MSRKFLLIFILTLISNLIYAEPNIPKNDIFSFDPSRACDVVSLKLEKMETALDEKKMTIAELLKSLRSAATPAAKYGNILLDYHRTLNQFKKKKKNYDQLILERENHCVPKSKEKSTN